MDGTNGWYRVNYSNRPLFGYPPFGMSNSAPDGGYALWSRYNNDTFRVFDALIQAVQPPCLLGVRGSATDVYLKHFGGFSWTADGRFEGGVTFDGTPGAYLEQKLDRVFSEGATVSFWYYISIFCEISSDNLIG